MAWAAGCGAVLLGTIVLVVLIVAVALWRRPDDAVGIEVEIVGDGIRSTGAVEATYHPEADIPLLTRGILGTSFDFDLQEPATLVDGRARVTLARGFRSIRDEWLHYARVPIDGQEICFGPMAGPIEDFPPELRSSGYVSSSERATRDGDVATLRAHALFLPSTIYYDRDVGTVRAIIEVHPITVTRLVDDEVQVFAPPGGVASLRVRVTRTGAGWPGARDAHGPPSDAPVEAVVVSRAALLAGLGWAAGFTPYIPITRQAWSDLRARQDPRFVVSAHEGNARSFDVRIPPGEAIDDMHVLLVAFEPGEDLAAGAEIELSPEDPDAY